MSILLIGLTVFLVWRIATGIKKGVVREVISLFNILFGALVLGLVCMIFGAFHEENYLGIALLILIIGVVSVVYSLLKIVFFSAKVISKLPVVSSADKLLGLVIGAVEALIVFWAMCCVLMYMDFGVLEQQIMVMISESKLLTGLYQYNLLGVLLEVIKAKLS